MRFSTTAISNINTQITEEGCYEILAMRWSITLSNLTMIVWKVFRMETPSIEFQLERMILEIGKSSIKMHLKHYEEQIEDILNYLDELSFHRIEKMEGRINGNELKTELKRIRTQIWKHQSATTAGAKVIPNKGTTGYGIKKDGRRDFTTLVVKGNDLKLTLREISGISRLNAQIMEIVVRAQLL
ncbi:hypothetical protein Tco_0789577 [Tanacetum coccineum]